MTVNSGYTLEKFSLGGPDYIFTFEYLNTSDVELYWLDADDAPTALQGGGYTIAPGPQVEGRYQGGTATVSEAPPGNAVALGVVRATDISQNFDYQFEGRFPSQSHEYALDKLTLICQELRSDLGLNTDGGGTPGTGLPPGTVTGALLYWNGTAWVEETEALYGNPGILTAQLLDVYNPDGSQVIVDVFDLAGVNNLRFAPFAGPVGQYVFRTDTSASNLSVTMKVDSNIKVSALAPAEDQDLITRKWALENLSGGGGLPAGTVEGQMLRWNIALQLWQSSGNLLIRADGNVQTAGNIYMKNPTAAPISLLMLHDTTGFAMQVDSADDVTFQKTDGAGAVLGAWMNLQSDGATLQGVSLNYSGLTKLATYPNGILVTGGVSASGGLEVNEFALIHNLANDPAAIVLDNGGILFTNTIDPIPAMRVAYGQIYGAETLMFAPQDVNVTTYFSFVTDTTPGTPGNMMFKPDGNIQIGALAPLADQDLVTRKWVTENISGSVPPGTATSQILRWNGTGWVPAAGIFVAVRAADQRFSIVGTGGGMALAANATEGGIFPADANGDAIGTSAIIGWNIAGNTLLTYNLSPRLNTSADGVDITGKVTATTAALNPNDLLRQTDGDLRYIRFVAATPADYMMRSTGTDMVATAGIRAPVQGANQYLQVIGTGGGMTLVASNGAGAIYETSTAGALVGTEIFGWQANAGINLRYNKSTRLSTTSAGVSITGEVNATGAVKGATAAITGAATAASLTTTGNVRAGAGSQAAPSLSFGGDTNTGFWNTADAIYAGAGNVQLFALSIFGLQMGTSISLGGNKITNMAAGTASTDGVRVSQLTALQTQVTAQQTIIDNLMVTLTALQAQVDAL